MVTETAAGSPDELTPLVHAAQRGDEDAFDDLYRRVQPGVLRYLHMLVGEDAEDVASETWLHVVRDLPTFRGDGKGFRGWAATIARNRAMDHLRHHRRRPSVSLPAEFFAEVAEPGDAASRATESISTDAALAMIATLPPDQAEAVLLRVVVGLDAQTAAQVLGKRSGAVRTAAYRGLRTLARLLKPADGA